MTDSLTQCIYEIKTNTFFELILGKGIDMGSFYCGEDGVEYCENLPISMFIKQAQNKLAPIFCINHGVDGLILLQDYIKNFHICIK